MRTSLFLTIILTLVCAACLSIGAIHAVSNADAILPVIISLQHWTPFYWGQDRFGMLIPLIAVPFHSPIVNFAVQNVLTFFLGMLAPLVIARYIYGRFEGYIIGSIALIFFVGLYPENSIQEYFGLAQPYGTALAICYTGMILLSNEQHLSKIKNRTVNTIGSLLILAAFWVTPSLIFTTLPITVLLGIQLFDNSQQNIDKSFKQKVINKFLLYKRSRYFPISIVILIAFLISGILSKTLYKNPNSQAYGFLAPSEWLDCWASFFMSFIQMNLPTITIQILFIIASITTLFFCIFSKNSALRKVMIIIMVAVCCEFFTMGTIEWVKLNNFFGRYLLISLILLLVGLSGTIFLGLIQHLKKSKKWLPVASSFILLTIILVRFGAPSWSLMENTLKKRFGKYTEDVIKHQCTHFTGNYWTVWPTVFDVNRVLYKENKTGTLWGITYRSENTIPLWKNQLNTNTRIACARKDKSVQQVLKHFDIKGRRRKHSANRIAFYQYIEDSKPDEN